MIQTQPAAADETPPPLPQETYVTTIARKNCTAMFYLLLIDVALWVLVVPAALLHLRFIVSFAELFHGYSFIAAIFAAIYLPLRWRVIRRLPDRYRRRGVVGGLGLIVVVCLQFLISFLTRFV